jgi:ABC-type sulfate transport system permease subunit
MKKRKGQTVVEYILVTVALVMVFVIMYRALQWAVADAFKSGAKVVVRTYIETYN